MSTEQATELVDMAAARRRRAEQRVHDRIDNLLATADRFDHERGSKALARRMRDKASGLETALRLLSGPPTESADLDPEALARYDLGSDDGGSFALTASQWRAVLDVVLPPGQQP